MYKKKKPQTERYDMQKLLTDRDSKEEYAKKIESELHKLDNDKPANTRLEDLFNVVTTSAKATLGIVKRTVKKGYYNNPNPKTSCRDISGYNALRRMVIFLSTGDYANFLARTV